MAPREAITEQFGSLTLSLLSSAHTHIAVNETIPAVSLFTVQMNAVCVALLLESGVGHT